MKKGLKYFMALLVALTLVVTAACGADNEPNTNNTDKNENENTNTEQNDNADTDANANDEENDDANENEDVSAATPLFRVEDQEISEGNYTDLNDHLDALKGLDEGSIVVKFNYTGDSLMSLFSLSDSDEAGEHFHLYIMPTAFGSENRAGETNMHVNSPDTVVEAGVDNTIAMVVSKEDGYKLYLNGELKTEDTNTAVKFLSNISNANSAQLGHTERGVDDNGEQGNPYPFSGTIEFAEVYSDVLTDAQVAEISAQ